MATLRACSWRRTHFEMSRFLPSARDESESHTTHTGTGTVASPPARRAPVSRLHAHPTSAGAPDCRAVSLSGSHMTCLYICMCVGGNRDRNPSVWRSRDLGSACTPPWSFISLLVPKIRESRPRLCRVCLAATTSSRRITKKGKVDKSKHLARSGSGLIAYGLRGS